MNVPSNFASFCVEEFHAELAEFAKEGPYYKGLVTRLRSQNDFTESFALDNLAMGSRGLSKRHRLSDDRL